MAQWRTPTRRPASLPASPPSTAAHWHGEVISTRPGAPRMHWTGAVAACGRLADSQWAVGRLTYEGGRAPSIRRRAPTALARLPTLARCLHGGCTQHAAAARSLAPDQHTSTCDNNRGEARSVATQRETARTCGPAMAATTVPVGSLPDVPTSADAGEPQVDDETQPVAVPPPKLGLKLEDEPFWSTKRWLNKGNVSNMVTFSIMIVFIILKMNDDANLAIDYGLAFGLFGFAVCTLPTLSLSVSRRRFSPRSIADAKTRGLCLCVSASLCLCVAVRLALSHPLPLPPSHPPSPSPPPPPPSVSGPQRVWSGCRSHLTAVAVPR